MHSERRLYPRYNVDFTVTIKPANGDQPFTAKAANLSQNGINLMCDNDAGVEQLTTLSYTDKCDLTFSLEDNVEHTYTARLSVKRRMSQLQYSLGFNFVDLAGELSDQLEEFLSLRRLNS